MPIFQYDNYRNPYGPSIAEALAHQADPQAQAALRSGDIEARAAQQQGALRAQQFSTLGAIPGEIQAERDRAIVRQRAAQQQQIGAQQLELGGYQVDAARRDAKTRNVMDAELRNPANHNPDGSLNDERFMQALQQQDVGAWQQYGALAAKNQQARLELLKTLGEIDKNVADTREKQQKVREAQLAYLSKASLSAYDATQQKPGDLLQARDTANAYIADGIASGAITPQQGAQFHLQTARAGPDQLAGTFLQMTDPELRAKIAKEQAETAASRATAARPVIVGPGASALAPPTPSGAPAGAPAAPPTVLYTAPETGKAYQKSSVLLDGKPAEVLLDPTPGGKVYDLSGAPIDNAATRIRPIPPASVQVLNQTLQGGQHVTDTAKAIAEYRVAPPSARSLSTPAGEMLMTQVMTANPAYDATQFPTRQKMRVAFTSGPQSQTINSLNTAIGHLDQFTEVVKALGNGNFQPGNQAYNWLKTTFGDSAPTNFEGIRSIMSGELAGAFKKSGATDQEIASVEHAIASKNSPKQLLDYVQTIALPALGSKVVSFDQQYRQVMGAADPFKILLPESEQILQKYGIDPAHPTMGAHAPAVVTAPTKGETRTANGETRVWDGQYWQPVK